MKTSDTKTSRPPVWTIAAGSAIILGVFFYVAIGAGHPRPKAASRGPCSGDCCCIVKAADTSGAPNASHRLTLDPKQFVGPVREAYQYAEENPALLAQLDCYCGCYKTDHHKNLLDCYRGTHGASCEICTSEVLMAKQLAEQGSPVDQIKDALRRRFDHPE
jgi:hypothetical protein